MWEIKEEEVEAEAEEEEEDEAEAEEDEMEAEEEQEEDKPEAEEEEEREEDVEEEEEEEEEDNCWNLEEIRDEKFWRFWKSCLRCISFLRFHKSNYDWQYQQRDVMVVPNRNRWRTQNCVPVKEEKIEEKKGLEVGEEQLCGRLAADN